MARFILGVCSASPTRLTVFAALILLTLAVSGGAEEGDWKVGDYYRITAKRGSAVAELEGVLAKATDRWLVLVDNDRRTEYGVPMFSKIPYLNRIFVNVGRMDSTIWIPRDAAIFELRKRIKKQPTSEFPIDEGPQLRESCTIHLVDGESQSTLLAVEDDKLTLAAYEQAQARRKTVALGDVVCVRFDSYSKRGPDLDAAIHAK